MREITFAMWLLIKKNKERGYENIRADMNDFFDVEKKIIQRNKTVYNINAQKTDRNVFVEISYGKTNPRPDTVLNFELEQFEANPRQRNQTELVNQVFVLYDFKTSILYFNNVNNRKILLDILNEVFQSQFNIVGLYNDPQKFQNSLREVSELQFTSVSDMFAGNSERENGLEKLLNTPHLTDFTLNVKFNKKLSHRQFSPMINQLFKDKRNYIVDGLLIRGIDEDGFETVFNKETFIRKIKINVRLQEDGSVLASEVKEHLINNIIRKENE